MKLQMIPSWGVALALFLMTGCAATQNSATKPSEPEAGTSTVFLKNGAQIKGVVLASIPDSIIKVQTADGSLMILKFSEVEKMQFNAPPTPFQRIEIRSGFLGQNAYFYKGKELEELEDLREVVLKANIPETRSLLDEANSQITLYNIVGGVGGAMMGWPLGAAIAGREFNAPLFAGGAAVATIGIVFAFNAVSKIERAVNLYNGTMERKVGMSLFFKPQDASLRVGFEWHLSTK